MVLTYTGKIYGIWCNIFSFKYDRPIAIEDIPAIKQQYEALTPQQKQYTIIYALAEAVSPLGEKPFLTVVPVSDTISSWLQKMMPTQNLNTNHTIPTSQMSATPAIEMLNDQELFESFLSRSNPAFKAKYPIIVVYFTANWCRACKNVNVPELMALRSDIKWFKVDMDENEYTGAYCGVKSIPSFQAIVNGTPLQLKATSDMTALRDFILSLRA
jgi:hypothetical protein